MEAVVKISGEAVSALNIKQIAVFGVRNIYAYRTVACEINDNISLFPFIGVNFACPL